MVGCNFVTGNAGKFSKNDSVIDLTVSLVPVESTKVDPAETSNGKVIRFSVKDYGKGIEEKDFKSIFEPFSQASKETQTVYGGTGLGLSVTSKLANRLGGNISLKSDYGKFAEFTVDLPFRGEDVDFPGLQKKLRETTIILVEPEEKYDYSFTDMKIADEPSPLPRQITESCSLNLLKCDSLDAAFAKTTRGGHYALLVHEDLFQEGTLQRLAELVGYTHYTVMTFGPNYSVDVTKGRHFKSLLGLFPSALLGMIAEHIEARKLEKQISIEKRTSAAGPSPAKTTSSPLFSIQPPASAPLFSIQPAAPASAPLFSIQPSAPTQSSTPAPLFAIPSSTTRSAPAPLFSVEPPKPSPSQQSPPAPLFAMEPSKSTPLTSASPAPLFATQSSAPTAITNPAPLFTINPPPGKSPTNLEQKNGSLFAIPNANGALTEKVPNQKTPPPASATKGVPAQRNMKILYAEDNLVNQKVLSRALTRLGVSDITIVDNGKKAVDICESVKFDLIFMDIQMPVMGGIEATKFITDRDPQANVVFVSAHALDEFKAQAREVGGIGFISKPFGLADIENALDKVGPSAGGTALKLPDLAPYESVPSATTKPPEVKKDKHAQKERKLKVLYAEDNAINQKVLTRVLARTGISDITVVDNGKKAVDICKTVKYDCVFMDVQMPVMGGVEATKLILEDDPQAKVVFVTAHALDEFREKVASIGATSYISKPFQLKDIENLLVELGLE